MALTKIQWADYTFNPWIGCSKVHAGCTNCYAEADMDKRRGRAKWGPSGTRSRTSADYWKQPLKWNHQARLEEAGLLGQRVRPRVFCASLADVFEPWDGPIVDHKGRQLFVHDCEPYPERDRYVAMPEGGPDALLPVERENLDKFRPVTMDDLRADLFRLIDATPNLDWLLLTKRPENVGRMWTRKQKYASSGGPARRNVWLGTSVSDQETADRMIPELLKCRDLSPVLFVSYEPALGPVDFWPYMHSAKHGSPGDPDCPIDLVIPGGESGPQARMCFLEWIQSAIQQCQEAGVACFVKQLGAFVVTDNVNLYQEVGTVDTEAYGKGTAAGVRILFRDKKGGDPDEWPEELRVRQLPIGGSYDHDHQREAEADRG